MFYTPLSDRALLQLSGEDAIPFLQGLVSNDVSNVKKGTAVYIALLTPQGKFLHDFFIYPWQKSILIDCDKVAATDLLQRLTMYKLRSKVAIELAPEHFGVGALWGSDAINLKHDNLNIFSDPRVPQLGYRIIGDSNAIRTLDMKPADEAAYNHWRLELGVPGSHDMIREKSLLLEFGFEDLHGVDFKKGCYVGQEVTARSKYRGQVRRFIYRVQADNVLPVSGTPVTLDGGSIGELRSSQGHIGLALLKVAEVEKAQAEHKHLYVGDSVLKSTLPPWVVHPPKAATAEK